MMKRRSYYSIDEILHFIHKHYQEHLSVTHIANRFKIERASFSLYI